MGHLVVIVFRILFVDIVQWACVYLIIVPGFGISCFLLIRTEWVSGTPYPRVLQRANYIPLLDCPLFQGRSPS